MNRGHIDRKLLERFGRGEVHSALAIEIAIHIDSCPGCAATAHNADPLSAVYAASDDTPVPDGLVDEILLMAAIPDNSRWNETWIVTGLLCAAVVALVMGTPGSAWLVQTWLVAKALLAGGVALWGLAAVYWPITTAAAAGALVLATGTSHVVNHRRMAA
jgi:hypothetical protein